MPRKPKPHYKIPAPQIELPASVWDPLNIAPEGMGRQQAQAEGYRYYVAARPCRHGHGPNPIYYTTTKQCVLCHRDAKATRARERSTRGGPHHTAHTPEGSRTATYLRLPLHLRVLEDARAQKGWGMVQVSERAGLGRNTYSYAIKQGGDLSTLRWIACANVLDIPIHIGEYRLTPDSAMPLDTEE